jgi:hypothetical protein
MADPFVAQEAQARLLPFETGIIPKQSSAGIWVDRFPAPGAEPSIRGNLCAAF